MDATLKQAVRDLLEEIDRLAESRRNISMEAFRSYRRVMVLREIVSTD